MDIINKISEKITAGAETVSKTANNIVETTKLKNKINKAQSEINSKYTEIGRIVKSELMESISNDEIKRLCTEIDDLLEQINENTDKINAIKGVKVCPECGTKVSDDDAFCPNCGKKQPGTEQSTETQTPTTVQENTEQAELLVEQMEQPVIENAVITCPNCGSKGDNATKFCSQCGTKME